MGFKKSTKILLGIATIWPIVYMFLFVIGMFAMVLLLPPSEGPIPPPRPGSPFLPIGFVGLFATHLLTMVMIVALMAFYIVRIFKTPMEEAMKIMWTVLICMFGMFAMPVFWYLYIWREPQVVAPGIAQLASAPASAFVNSTQPSGREQGYRPPEPPDWR